MLQFEFECRPRRPSPPLPSSSQLQAASPHAVEAVASLRWSGSKKQWRTEGDCLSTGSWSTSTARRSELN